MTQKVEFRQWEDYCDAVWEEIPGFKPRIVPLPGKAGFTSGQYDLLSSQILEQADSEEEDKDIVYVNKRAAHSDEIVQSGIQARWHEYVTCFPRKFPLHQKCPYCRERLRKSRHGNERDIEDMQLGALETCPNCSYWEWHYIQGIYIHRPSSMAYYYTSLLGKVREFDNDLPDGCSEEIARWIRRNPSRWHSINPTALEKLVAGIFRANYQHSEVTHVGKPDDGGIDVIFVDAESRQWLIQVKRREKPDHTESVATIRNLLGTMILENASHGIVVSTGDHFSYRAYDAIHRAKERGMIVELINRKVLNQMLERVLIERPWLGPLHWAFPEFSGRLLRGIPSKDYRQLSLL